jgi:hypothetical protein
MSGGGFGRAQAWLVAGLVAAAVSAGGGLALSAGAPQRWWTPGEGRVFPARLDYDDPSGKLRLLLDGGPMDTRGHPFFEALGTNGRACVTCHQPADGMSLSAASAQRRWRETGGKDPLFAAIDGSNCPDLPQGERASHSLLLDKGLFRIARPWPPRDLNGRPIRPDFDIEVVRDPTGCNLSARWGLHGASPAVSVFRRPRPVANFKYILATGFEMDPKAGLPLPIDPETGKLSSHNLMADGRALSLAAQMREAGQTHLQMIRRLTPQEIGRIVDFEQRIYAAQQSDSQGGELDAAGAEGGPGKLKASEPGRLGSQGVAVWSEYSPWETPKDDPTLTPAERAFRASVARGARLFRERTFLISDSAGVNSPMGFGNPVRNSCVFCHNMSQMGMDVAPGQVDLGTTNLPFADPQPDLPLFRITCRGPPHPHYGPVIFTHDPGYALTTGRCADVGRITLQSLRGLAARAPYFSNGSAKDLRAVIDYYDRRYNIGYTEQEKQDLVNLMRAL